MKLFTCLLFWLAATAGFAQDRVATFTVITDTSAARSSAPKRIGAVLAAQDDSEHIDSLKIKFYPGASKFHLNGESGLLTWFSYTNPPKDKKWINVEADQTSFGSLLYRNTLYVCTPGHPRQSLPVINEFLKSANATPLTKADAQAVALLTAKCSDTLQVYGDIQPTSQSTQALMQKVASPPVTTMVDGDIHVEFYSWSALPDGAISKWSFLFRADRLAAIARTEVSKAEQ